METDFLNFHEEGYPLLETPYQDELDNKNFENWETLDVNDSFELALELDYQKTINDWEKFNDDEDDTQDSEYKKAPNNTLLSDMFDNLEYTQTKDELFVDSNYLKYKSDLSTAITQSLLDKSNFNGSVKFEMGDIFEPDEVKVESIELENVADSFDLTEYVYGNGPKKPDLIKMEPNSSRKNADSSTSSCSSSSISNRIKESIVRPMGKQMDFVQKHKSKFCPNSDKSDSEEDICVDVETVSENESEAVLEAKDVTSLLEQFEANEINANNNQHNSMVQQKVLVNNVISTAGSVSVAASSSSAASANTASSVKKNNVSVKTDNKDILNALPQELIDRIKNSGKRKAVPLIPAIPPAKRSMKNNSNSPSNKNKPKTKKNNCLPASDFHVQLDHDYCRGVFQPVLVTHNSYCHSPSNEQPLTVHSSKPHDFEELLSTMKDSGFVSEDIMDDEDSNGGGCGGGNSAHSAAEKRPSVTKSTKIWVSKNLFPNAIKNQPIVKNADGKLMVSLLKSNTIVSDNSTTTSTCNNTNSSCNKSPSNITSEEQQQQQKPIDKMNTEEANAASKRMKRKLNLAEYKKRRETNVCHKSNDNSGINSPKSGNCSSPSNADEEKDLERRKMEHQEKLLRMAAELLNTKSSNCSTSKPSIQAFVPPTQQQSSPKKSAVKKSPPPPSTAASSSTPTAPPAPEQQNPPKSPPKAAISNDYEVKTIVSIGVNTIVTLSQVKQTFKTKLNEMKPVLESAMVKINSNSLITSLLENIPKVTPNKLDSVENQQLETNKQAAVEEHGEDKTIIVLNKNRTLPTCKSIHVQTDFEMEDTESLKEDLQTGLKIDLPRSTRPRRDSSSSSTRSSVTSGTRRSRYRKNGKSRRRSLSRQTRSSWSSSSSRMSNSSRSRSRSTSKYSESSYSSSLSRSRSNSPLRWQWHNDHHSNDRSSSRNSNQSRRFSNEYYRNINRNGYARHKDSKEMSERERERLREVEERRVIYVGGILDGTTKNDLRRRFQRFGPINRISVHFRDHGDNYGFVTFAYKVDAYAAVEHGNDDPNDIQYDLSFGGRRAFCRTTYADLDKIDDCVDNPPVFREEDSFDILLREAQAKLLRNRKV